MQEFICNSRTGAFILMFILMFAICAPLMLIFTPFGPIELGFTIGLSITQGIIEAIKFKKV